MSRKREYDIANPFNLQDRDEKDEKDKDALTELRSFGLSLRLPKYSGTQGGCRTWWEDVNILLHKARVPRRLWYPLVLDAVQGGAQREVTRTIKANSSISLEDLLQHLIKIYDRDQTENIIVEWRRLSQWGVRLC